MPNIAVVLREEIQRLARREVSAQVGPIKRRRAEDRRAIAALKREVSSLKRTVSFLEKREKRRLERAPEARDAENVRFSPKWVAADRERLGLSARSYGRLVGVSMLTIYNWEKGKSKPGPRALAGWAKVRGIGKRETLRRLELLDG